MRFKSREKSVFRLFAGRLVSGFTDEAAHARYEQPPDETNGENHRDDARESHGVGRVGLEGRLWKR